MTICATIVVGLALFALSAPASAQGPAQAAPQVPAADLPKRVAIRFLTAGDYPPFNYYDEEGILTGFNIDMARAICLELSATCDLQVRPWADLQRALRRGEGDAIIAAHAVTAQLVQDFDVSDRYFFTPGWFVGRRGGRTLTPTPEGLEALKVGVVRGSPHEAYLRAFFRASPIVVFENAELARDAVIGARVDLVFDDGLSLALWLNGTLSRECCEFKAGPFYEPKFFGDGVGVVIPKRDVQLKGLVNQALGRVRSSGRYEELLLRYFPSRLF